jgi:VanZ family protein
LTQLATPPTSALPTSTRPSFLRAWWPTLVWIGLIAIESTDYLSSNHTGSILYPILHYLFGITPEQFVPIHAITRKTGHVVGYGMLSFLAFRSWRATLRRPGQPSWSFAWARNAVFLTAFIASLDEWHQTFIPSRTGTIYDVMLDTAAGIAAQVVVYIFLGRKLEGRQEAS